MNHQKLLLQASNGAWCIYYRDPMFIPSFVMHSAKQIYNLETGESIKVRLGPMFSTILGFVKEDIPSEVDVENLPEAENVLVGGMFVRGIRFGDNFIG